MASAKGDGAAAHDAQAQQPREVEDLAASVRSVASQSNGNGYGALEESTASLLSPPLSVSGEPSFNFRKRSRRQQRQGSSLGHGNVQEEYEGVAYEDDRLVPSPFDISSVKVTFAIGCILLLVTVLCSLILLLNLFVAVPSLLPPHRSPSLTSLWLFFLSLLILLPSLFLFEFTSLPTSTLHVSNAFALLILLTLLSALNIFREGEAWIATPAAMLAWLSCAWAWAAGRVVDGVRLRYKLEQPARAFHQEDVFWQRPSTFQSESLLGRRDELARAEAADERQPLLGTYAITTIHVPLKRAQSKLTRSLKLLLATAGTTAVTACLLMLIFDVALTGADSGFAPTQDVGERIWIDLRKPPFNTRDFYVQGWKKIHKRASISDFRVHLKCESVWDSTYRPEIKGVAPRAKKPPPPPRKSIRPTALVMTERGVSGIVGAEWVREMVQNAKDEDGKDGDDGHLALESVCYWDRLGYGFSDFVEGASGDVELHTEILQRALEAQGAWSLPPTGNTTDDAPQVTDERRFGGPFMLISTGYGSLFARHFAATYPEYVHSQIFIDAETPQSWYTNVVAKRSGLRAGHAAPGHNHVGLLLHDLLPAVLSPLGITHFFGLLAGKGPADRVLSPRNRGGASRRDFGGGGFRVIGAGGSSQKLLTTSLHERLDANAGTGSTNYKALSKEFVREAHEVTLAKKPTAVLSSFWKNHRDQPGWGTQQRDGIVRHALEQGGLVGWWRVGGRMERGSGGSDDGAAQGICESPQGRIFCNEAVRKILAAADLNEADQGASANLSVLTYDVGQ